jgi:predicted nucleic acid-binding protein
VIYLDSSALVKLVLKEPESDVLRSWLDSFDESKSTSELAHVEVLRACRRVTQESVPRARRVLDGLDLVPTTPGLLDSAALADPAHLRSLDAIHLAAAASLRDDLTAFVTYDHRLAAAAQAASLPISAPA